MSLSWHSAVRGLRRRDQRWQPRFRGLGFRDVSGLGSRDAEGSGWRGVGFRIKDLGLLKEGGWGTKVLGFRA